MNHLTTQVVVIGSGPGGYSAAFRAADLGLQVILVEKYQQLGGVCLNVGCIPSKALLHVAEQLTAQQSLQQWGISPPQQRYDLDAIRTHQTDVVDKMSQNIATMAKQRNVTVVTGTASFTNKYQLLVEQGEQQTAIQFDQAIIAVGSRPNIPAFLPDDPRIMDSTAALQLKRIPARLLVIGGGIIGLELGTVYQALGSEVTIVEFTAQLVPAADKNLVSLYQRSNKDRFNIMLNTRVDAIATAADRMIATLSPANADPFQAEFDAVLVAIGRRPNGDRMNAEAAGIFIDEHGFIPVNSQLQTNIPHIYAIGDVTGNPMLAHRASHQAHTAAEVIAGHSVHFSPVAIPSIAYTQPEIAWTGLTEKELKAEGQPYRTAILPWGALGRAHASHTTAGRTKLIYAPDSGQLLGAGIVGQHAGELIGELTLALEFAANIEDLGLTVHAHPTLHESIGLAGEVAMGTVTDVLQRR